MSEAKPNQEPTMEEILASIRRIISEDGDNATKPPEEPVKPAAVAAPSPPPPPPASPAAAAPPPPAPAPPVEDEVLELTEVVAEPAPPPPQTPSAPPAAPVSAVAPQTPPPSQAAAPPPPRAEPTVADLITDDLALVSTPVANVAASKFTDLAAAVTQVRGLPVTNRTLEDIVKELLRPMLTDWLDANLPTLVHRIVEREVAKLAGRVDDQGH
jgi:cell pole-organizing protein PopZ